MGKSPAANAGDTGDPVRSLGKEESLNRKWKPMSVFLLENSIDRGAWCATIQGHKESNKTEPTHTHTHTDKQKTMVAENSEEVVDC